jgi:serine/threonine protein kinase
MDHHAAGSGEMRDAGTPSQAEAVADWVKFAQAQTPPPSSPAATHGPRVVKYFGEYELLEEIARGGMGVVYKARQISLDRVVALKLILSGKHASPSEIERFYVEAKSAANLNHEGIVAIHEVGEFEGQHYFSMDYVAGLSLAQMTRTGPLPAKKAARYMSQVAEAIEFAHRQGTLHRDLKPSNVLIDRTDQPRVTDFGLAKRVDEASPLTVTGETMGTPGYMPPEQVTSGRAPLGPAADVYSLGATLYELLTGRPPFQGPTTFDTLLAVCEHDPVPPRLLNPRVPRDLETICLKCLQKDPRRRYVSASALANDLRRFLANEPIAARPAGLPFLTRIWIRQHLSALGWTVLVGIICGLMVSVAGISTRSRLWADVADAYQSFPSLSAPHSSFDLPGWARSAAEATGPWSRAAFIVTLAMGMIGCGFLPPILTRSSSRASDMATGAAGGLIAALTSLALCLGPMHLANGQTNSLLAPLAQVRVNADEDGGLERLTSEELVRQFPDLREMAPDERGVALYKKVAADVKLANLDAFWNGIRMAAFMVPTAIVLAFAGGSLARREYRFFSFYGSFSYTDNLLAAGTIMLYPFIVWTAGGPAWELAAMLFWLVLASILIQHHGYVYHEHLFRRHLPLVAALVVAASTAAVRFADAVSPTPLVTLPWWLDVLVDLAALVLVAAYVLTVRQRGARSRPS